MRNVPNAEVIGFNTLTVDFAKEIGASLILKGIRSFTDFEYEFQMLGMNRVLHPNLETIMDWIEGSWVQTGGLSGIEVVGSEATLFQHPEHGLVTAAPRQDPKPVAQGEEKPTRVDRLVAAIEGNISKEELDADLACTADAVAIMEACYQSNESGGWVDVPAI